MPKQKVRKRMAPDSRDVTCAESQVTRRDLKTSYLPPSRPPVPLTIRKRPGSTSAMPHHRDKRPSRREPWYWKMLSAVGPDSVAITRLEWRGRILNNTVEPGPAGTGDFLYALPLDKVLVSYRVVKGLMPFTEGVLVVRIGDGVLSAQHAPVLLPPTHAESNGVVEVDGWLKPFPAHLYGFHQLIVELWAVTPTGQPLPPESQTNPPDTRLFAFQSSDWAWVWVSPGCRDRIQGGVDWIKLNSATASPTTVTLDSTGTKVAGNQSVQVSWNFSSAGLAPTAYGYNGSATGLRIGRLGYDTLYLAHPADVKAVDQISVDLSGLPFPPGAVITVDAAGTECFTQVVTVAIAGKGMPVAPANVVCTNSGYEPYQDLQASDPFAVWFLLKNMGGQPSGQLTAHIVLDATVDNPSGTDSGPLSFSLQPGAETALEWPFAQGLPAGYHDFDLMIGGVTICSQGVNVFSF